MSHRSLLLLGLLISQSQHGYQIHDFIEKNLTYITNMKKATAYSMLDKLSKEQYIDVTIEYEGNRPPRKVYSINEKGIEYFQHLLMQNLASAETTAYKSEIGFMFLDHLTKEQTMDLLKKKQKELEEKHKTLRQVPNHEEKGINIAFLHKKKMLEAEISFLTEIIDKLTLTGVN